MLPTSVALVPLENPSKVTLAELTQVSTALQTQVNRDLKKAWDVSAVITPFATLEEVPPEFFPLAVTEHPLPLHRHGFHFTMGGLPFGLVEYGKDLSIAASHELLEMLCDPWGQRTASAPSLADARADALKAAAAGGKRATGRRTVIKGDRSAYTPQGPVNYMIEVCDPVEDSTYEIDRVAVSEFVTPNYYDTRTRSRPPYSNQGSISKPLEVLEGGSLSWRTRLPHTLIYQARTKEKSERAGGAKAGGSRVPSPVSPVDLEISKILDGASRLSIDSQRSGRRARRGGASRPVANGSPTNAAEAFRQDVTALLDWLRFQIRERPPSLDEIIELLERLDKDAAFWRKFSKDPTVRERELGRIGVKLEKVPASAGTRNNYRLVLRYLREQKKVSGIFGPDLMEPGIALWMCMQIG